MFTLGHARLLEYQGRAYADLYVSACRPVLAAEREADPTGARGFATTARSRAGSRCGWRSTTSCGWPTSRAAPAGPCACAREVRAGDDDLLRVYDHFKPGVPEFAALLPPSLARRLLAWDRAARPPAARPGRCR
jgi:indolepyruvate ferredoxin oxidoreductase beta subunit